MESNANARQPKLKIAEVEPFKKWLRTSGARRAEGKSAFVRGDYVSAVATFTLCLQRIKADDADERSLLLSNRSAAYLAAGAAHYAAADAYDLLDLRPGWPKSYLRLGHASRAMGGAKDAEDWYLAGANAATVQGLAKDAAKLNALASAAAAAAAKVSLTTAAAPPPPGSAGSQGEGEEDDAARELRMACLHSELASRMGIESWLFYSPLCLEDRALELSVESSPRFYATLTALFGCEVRDIGVMNRGLFATKSFAEGEPVFLDEPLLRVCLAEALPEEVAPPRGAPVDCGQRIRALRAQCIAAAAAGATHRAFFPLAAVRIAGLTLARWASKEEAAGAEDGVEEIGRPGIHGIDSGSACSTFELPQFACYCRASDFARQITAGEYKVSFVERYNEFTSVRDALGLGASAYGGRFDFKWFDDVWSMLLLNMIGGTTVTDRDSFSLMALGSFCNHADAPSLDTYEMDGGARLGFVATRSIRAGDALTIRYVDPGLAPDVQRAILRDQYLIYAEAEEGGGPEDGDGVD
jgi:hypothetical protein